MNSSSGVGLPEMNGSKRSSQAFKREGRTQRRVRVKGAEKKKREEFAGENEREEEKGKRKQERGRKKLLRLAGFSVFLSLYFCPLKSISSDTPFTEISAISNIPVRPRPTPATYETAWN